MTRRFPIHQRGAALLAMVAIIALGSAWYLASRLNTESGQAAAAAKARNTQVLNRAKAALIGYVAARAVNAIEARPGSLPCPEAPADFNDGTSSEGTVSYPCTLPIVGRFPWRTLGLDKLVDAAEEPLWYAIAPGWAGANTVINSDCASPASAMACATGRLTVDGVTSDVIALIIAPGPVLNVSASANCSAWTQVRPTTPPPDWRNYLECENATSPADTTFATTGPAGSFNDQVVRITVGELLPAVEAAIASRIDREIVPVLNAVYTPAGWTFAGANPLYPYAVPFGPTFPNPGPGAGTSDYVGVAGTYQGLLPFNQTNCTASPSNPRCLPTLISWSGAPAGPVETSGFGGIDSMLCLVINVSDDTAQCVGTYHDGGTNAKPARLEMSGTLANVARGLRKVDPSKMTVEAKSPLATDWEAQTVSYIAKMNADGSATLTFGATMPVTSTKGWGSSGSFRVTMARSAITDHTLLDPTNTTTGWFARNEWYRQMYYATVAKNTAIQLPAALGCTPGTNCLTVTTNSTALNNRSAILILAGRSVNGNARPSAQLADYLEFGNVTANYESQTVTRAAANAYVDTGAANAYVVPASIATGRPFLFKVNPLSTPNTAGASTLSTTATGAKNLKNVNGSDPAASQLQAGAVGEVTYDGTQFVLNKRPFNDRVVVVCPRPVTAIDPAGCP